MKDPNYKLQAPEKNQAPIAEMEAAAIFGDWNLEFLWSLELEVWCF